MDKEDEYLGGSESGLRRRRQLFVVGLLTLREVVQVGELPRRGRAKPDAVFFSRSRCGCVLSFKYFLLPGLIPFQPFQMVMQFFLSFFHFPRFSLSSKSFSLCLFISIQPTFPQVTFDVPLLPFCSFVFAPLIKLCAALVPVFLRRSSVGGSTSLR